MAKDEAAIEAEIQAKGLNAPRLTPAHIDAQILDAHYYVVKPLTICIMTLQNGFQLLGKSASASPENFDAELGKKIAYEDARNQIWALEGYRLRAHLAGQTW